MCLPAATLALIAVGTAAAGTIVSTVGAIQQGKAAKRQADYSAAVSKNNAILAERQAADALSRGRLKERQKRLQLSRLEGSQRAAFAANNVVLNTGSPLDVLEFTAQQNELEALTIRSASEREALGFRTRGANLTAESELFTMAGKQAKTAGFIGGFSSLLGGASQTAGMASQFKTAGAFT